MGAVWIAATINMRVKATVGCNSILQANRFLNAFTNPQTQALFMEECKFSFPHVLTIQGAHAKVPVSTVDNVDLGNALPSFVFMPSSILWSHSMVQYRVRALQPMDLQLRELEAGRSITGPTAAQMAELLKLPESDSRMFSVCVPSRVTLCSACALTPLCHKGSRAFL